MVAHELASAAVISKFKLSERLSGAVFEPDGKGGYKRPDPLQPWRQLPRHVRKALRDQRQRHEAGATPARAN